MQRKKAASKAASKAEIPEQSPESVYYFAKPEEPQTVCVDCAWHRYEKADPKDADLECLSDHRCLASAVYISPVTGKAIFRDCIIVNTGKCPKYRPVEDLLDDEYPEPTLWERIKVRFKQLLCNDESCGF